MFHELVNGSAELFATVKSHFKQDMFLHAGFKRSTIQRQKALGNVHVMCIVSSNQYQSLMILQLSMNKFISIFFIFFINH